MTDYLPQDITENLESFVFKDSSGYYSVTRMGAFTDEETALFFCNRINTIVLTVLEECKKIRLVKS